MEFKDTVHDLDSSMDTWELLYCKVYKDKFSSLFDFNNIEDTETSDKCKRYYIKINKEEQPEFRNEYPKFKIAGDCDFNFNDKKVDLFKKFLLEEDIPLLMECHNNHHELWNFSFMPISGAMNNKKGCLKCITDESQDSVPYDRPDLLVCELDRYYKGEPTRIFSRFNKDALKWYLSNFSDVYDYCKDIYLIDDKSFVDRLIESGKQPIDSRNRALEYMKLANEFWNIKKNKLKNIV